MADLTMGVIESRFAQLIWEREPVTTAELNRLAAQELGWKKSTMYTVLKRLCEKGIFQLEGGVVTSLLSRDAFRAAQSEQLIDDAFGGSVPAFLAAFTRRRKLSEQEIAEIREMIDERGRGE